jgi:hypothetical protein
MEKSNLIKDEDYDSSLDPDMEITRVDVPRSHPSWPVPTEPVQQPSHGSSV